LTKDLQAIQNDLSKVLPSPLRPQLSFVSSAQLEPRAQLEDAMNNPGFILRIPKFLATARNQKKQAEKNIKPADLEPEVVANNSQPAEVSDEVQESRDSPVALDVAPQHGDVPDQKDVNDDDDTMDLSSASASNPSRPQLELKPNWYDSCS